MPKKFLRTDFWRMSKLGAGRRKLQVWRRAKGKHSKMRRRRKGYPAIPGIGYKNAKADSGKINGMIPVLVSSMNDFAKIQNGEAAILSSRIGARKRLEMIKKAESMKIKRLNLSQEKKK